MFDDDDLVHARNGEVEVRTDGGSEGVDFGAFGALRCSGSTIGHHDLTRSACALRCRRTTWTQTRTGRLQSLYGVWEYYSRNTRRNTRRRTATERATRRKKATQQAPERACTTPSDLPAALPCGSSVEMCLLISLQSLQTHRSVPVQQSAFRLTSREIRNLDRPYETAGRQTLSLRCLFLLISVRGFVVSSC